MEDRKVRPSEAFAARLKELRNARGLSQAELAKLMNDAGQEMSKVALLRIEKGQRGLSLDEALAFAAVLRAVPAHMLSPRAGEVVMLTKNEGVDGEGLRAWLRTGDAFGDFQPKLGRDLERLVRVHAEALVDARDDRAGQRDALVALGRTALRYQDALIELERRGLAEPAEVDDVPPDSKEGEDAS